MFKPQTSGGRRQPAAERAERASLRERISNYFRLHSQILVASLGRIYRAPIASAMTTLVIAIALTLPASFLVIVKNAEDAAGGLEVTNRISLFLKPELNNDTGRRLIEKLSGNSSVSEARLITKEAGLQELKEYSGFGDVLKSLDSNPLPVVIAIQPKDSLARPEDTAKLLESLKKLPECDYVQSDMDWLRKLNAMLSIVERGTLVLGTLLSLAILFIIGNTIRLDLQNREEEIAVARLMGATNGFIRRPFMYTGLWYGLLGGVMAWILTSILILILRIPVRQLSELYGGNFELSMMNFSDSCSLIGSSVILGMAGAIFVVTHHLGRLSRNGTS